MADETGREDIEGISIDEFMGTANETSEDISIDGAIDDMFNIDDINLDDISLADLMVDDLDDDDTGAATDNTDVALSAETAGEGGVTDSGQSDSEEIPAPEPENDLPTEEMPKQETSERNMAEQEILEPDISVPEPVTQQEDVQIEEPLPVESIPVAAGTDSVIETESEEDMSAYTDLSEELLSDDADMDILSGEDAAFPADDTDDFPDVGTVEAVSEDDGTDGIEGLEDIDIGDAAEISDDDISEDDIDLMQLLAGDEDDDFELLDDERPSADGDIGGSGDEQPADEAEDANTGKKSKQKENVFADPLSVLSDDVDDEADADGFASAVDDVDEIINSAKEKSKKKKKKKGKGIGKIFSNIVDEKELEKVEQEKREAEQAEKKKEADAEKKQKLAEEKAGKKEEKKLAKEQLKESKKQEKEAKKRAKKEAKELRKLEEETEIEGRINKVGAAVVFALTGCVALFVFFGTKMFSYNSGVSKAMSYYENGRYIESYNELLGEDLKEEDMALYNKVVTIMYVYKQFDAYDAYYKAAQYPQALDSLLKGIREYEKYMPDAIEFDVTDNFDTIKNQILGELSAEYGITEEMAGEINNISDSEEYSRRVYALAQNLSSNYY